MQLELKRNVFIPPTTLDEAEAIKNSLITDIEGIQIQLGNRAADLKEFGPLADPDYHSWRRRAKDALQIKKGQLRDVKQWIKTERAAMIHRKVEGHDAVGLLVLLYDTAKDLAFKAPLGMTTPDHWQVLDMVRDYLREQGLME